jgi:hypothetical protein
MGPYRGGQAQYIRIPYADFNALKLPPGKEHESDFILLAGMSDNIICILGTFKFTNSRDRYFPHGYDIPFRTKFPP